MLSGRGFLIVNLNGMIFHVKDGASVIKVNAEVRAPKLHYVDPTCFEAGKPMEFVACRSNLLQPKFRFLICFAGKYLPDDICITCPHAQSEGGSALCLTINCTRYLSLEQNQMEFGPAFIEAIAALWILSVVGSWCNFLTSFYIVFVLLRSVPVIYDKYEDKIDPIAKKATIEIKKQYAVFDVKVLSKIPKGSLKGKKV